MIFLEIHNRVVEEILLSKFENARQMMKHEKFDYTLADFDGAIYRLHSMSNDKSKILLDFTVKFFKDLQKHGVDEVHIFLTIFQVLKREYGENLCENPQPKCSVSLIFDLERLPEDYISLSTKAALLKRNCFAAVFEKYFEFQARAEEVNDSKRAVIHYRDDETL
ncbi:unnamed protein product [Protopolystoma xenopodis]|uniref:Arp2/3 complex 34 kDa subunit n=1 Tax=Protopolystoma xenopodis TaxID=117903 RepID=A0A448X768_9PLAT|nr:unnamed protein product [Protopolystoma xenopodis]